MFETSVIEISRTALQNNLQFIRQQVGPGTRLCSVVKGNAYGHSLPEFANLAMEFGIDYFAVYSTDEAYRLHQSLQQKADIFIMGAADGDALNWAIENEIEVNVFDFDRLQAAFAFARKAGKKARLHLEVETGMNRTGFDLEELPELCQLLKQNHELFELIGLTTHFAGAESLSNDFRIKKQMLLYSQAKDVFAEYGLVPTYCHIACSAAVMNYPHTICNMVRVGIMQYGFWPNNETFIRYSGHAGEAVNPLRRLIRWKSQVMDVKHVKKGDFIGYGTSYLAHRNMSIAVVPVGYAHGFSRSLSNSGRVLIHGETAPVTGIVNMNVISVDITHIPGVEKGDEVVMIGRQKDKSITVASFGEMSEQLNYELLIRLPKDIPRVVVD